AVQLLGAGDVAFGGQRRTGDRRRSGGIDLLETGHDWRRYFGDLARQLDRPGQQPIMRDDFSHQPDPLGAGGIDDFAGHRQPSRHGRAVMPPPGRMPTRAWVSAKTARSDATRKSQPSAISSPPVNTAPLIAAMI